VFDLNTYLRERAAAVEAALDAFMPKADEPPALLHAAMRYSVFSGGKRLRPVLCLAAAEACGGGTHPGLRPPLQGGDVRDGSCPGPSEGGTHPAMFAAMAVELLHTYTLIHDDLPCMDDDDMRRGKPTSHKVYGEANAVLAGDALQALAFEAAAGGGPPALPGKSERPMSSGRSPGPDDFRARIVLELARAAGSRGVAGGQVEDLAAEGAAPDPARIEFIHRHKTADLFRAAPRMGALAAGGAPEAVEALSVYGENLGLAFQITDDLLDRSPGYPPDEGKRRAEALTAAAIRALDCPALTLTDPLKAVAEFLLERTI
jgi:geranylgeranyl diphosphate synthase type II